MRSIRVPDEQWHAWQGLAELEEISVSKLVRQAVERYVAAKHKPKVKKRPKKVVTKGRKA